MDNYTNTNLKKSLTHLLFLLFIPIVCAGFIETKRFDAKPVPRSKYLRFVKPPVLQFSDPVVKADRRMLLSLSIPSSNPNVSNFSPSNDSNSTPEIPVIAYEDDQIMPGEDIISPTTIPQSESILPSADPFDESASNPALDSTDDLLDIFEQDGPHDTRLHYNAIPFIPPFTSAPDNLKIESKASYRKVRK